MVDEGDITATYISLGSFNAYKVGDYRIVIEASSNPACLAGSWLSVTRETNFFTDLYLVFLGVFVLMMATGLVLLVRAVVSNHTLDPRGISTNPTCCSCLYQIGLAQENQ